MAGSERSRITALTDAFYLRVRHRAAWDSATAAPVGWQQGLDSLRGRKYCLLTTFRKSGEPVPTPVWFGIGEGRVYFTSEATVGKVKRIRNNPRTLVAPCTSRGRPLGPPIEGRARVMAPGESEQAERAIASNYGLFRKVYEAIGSRLPIDEVYIEVESPDEAGRTDAGTG